MPRALPIAVSRRPPRRCSPSGPGDLSGTAVRRRRVRSRAWSSAHSGRSGDRGLAHRPRLRQLRRDRLGAGALRPGNAAGRGASGCSTPRWDLGITTLDTADAYGGGRSEEYIGEWLRTKPPDVRDRVVDRDEDLQPDGRGRRPRPRRRPHPAAGRDEPAPPRASSACRSTWPTSSIRTCRRRRRSARSTSSSAPARSVPSARRTSRPSSSPRRSSSPSSKGLTRYEWVQNAYSLLEQARSGDGVPALPRARPRVQAFGPLAGGWLTGKYRRGEPPPAGSRMTLRPEGERALPGRRDVRRPRGVRARGGRARRVHGRRSRSRGCLQVRRSRPSSSARAALEHLAPVREALEHPSSTDDERDALGRMFAMSVLVLGERRRPRDCSTWAGASRRWRTSLAGARARGALHAAPLDRPVPDGGRSLGLMPAYRGGEPSRSSPSRRSSSSPGNPARGLDPHQGAVLLHDGETGHARRGAQRVADHGDPHRGRLGRRDEAARAARSARQVAILGVGRAGRARTREAMRAVLPRRGAPGLEPRRRAHAEALALESHAARLRDGGGGPRRRRHRLHVHRRRASRSCAARGSRPART